MKTFKKWIEDNRNYVSDDPKVRVIKRDPRYAHLIDDAVEYMLLHFDGDVNKILAMSPDEASDYCAASEFQNTIDVGDIEW